MIDGIFFEFLEGFPTHLVELPEENANVESNQEIQSVARHGQCWNRGSWEELERSNTKVHLAVTTTYNSISQTAA